MANANEYSRLELRLQACLDNYRYFRGLLRPETRLLVLVKANAYGHGAVEFASMMQRAGADYLAVALPVEGAELRAGGISLPILVLTAGTDSFPEIIADRLEPGIPNLAALKTLCAVLERKGLRDYPVHIKIDSGMHRLGFSPSELDALCASLKDAPQVRVKSVYSHLAASEDPAEDAFTLGQAAAFTAAADRLEAALGYAPMRHLLNSAGIERFPQFQFDMVRLGIGIYGISALPGVQLSPVASFKVKVLQVKELKEGDTVGYNRRGAVPAEGMRIATIPAGYADGLDRRLGCGHASFSLNGQRVPTVGNICMDMCMIDVTGLPVHEGDTVTIFGQDPTVGELAGILGTIPYEILTSVPRRIPRIIV
ncbi:MAG: alanine racemase [Bacteroidales bacterium]|nr:alanine racemase [Bacteroidales bacterium]